MNRRDFLRSIGIAAFGVPFIPNCNVPAKSASDIVEIVSITMPNEATLHYIVEYKDNFGQLRELTVDEADEFLVCIFGNGRLSLEKVKK